MSDSKEIRYYRDLQVWQKAIQLAKSIYRISASFPNEEKYGLVSQIRRASVSVPSNIAEGQARNTTGEFIQFLSHAEGSLAEVDTQLFLATEFEFCTFQKAGEIFEQVSELRRMLQTLKRRLIERSHN
ncbi:MAG TPA: four helix bundle protein [Terriglobia bacterium]|nr:four helix bundle protein [Terriglobia bacterium]